MRFFRTVLLLTVLTVLPFPAESGGRIRYTISGGHRYLSLRDIAAFYRMNYFADDKYVYLRSKTQNMSFALNKRSGGINGTVVVALFPVLPGKYDSYLSEHDFRYVVEPVLRSDSLVRRPVRVILLDPGHGGTDKGAPCANGRSEKETALAVTRKVANLLRSRGFTVYMTRNSDRTLSLDQRTVITSRIKPDLFISIHCNSASRTIKGVETFAATPVGAPSSSDKKIGTTVTPSEPFNAYNYRLAYEIQTSLRKNTKTVDRGVKHARYYVIRNAACPAVLVEIGFVSNPYECMRLFSEWGRNQVAASVVNGILSYCRVVK